MHCFAHTADCAWRQLPLLRSILQPCRPPNTHTRTQAPPRTCPGTFSQCRALHGMQSQKEEGTFLLCFRRRQGLSVCCLRNIPPRENIVPFCMALCRQATVKRHACSSFSRTLKTVHAHPCLPHTTPPQHAFMAFAIWTAFAGSPTPFAIPTHLQLLRRTKDLFLCLTKQTGTMVGHATHFLIPTAPSLPTYHAAALPGVLKEVCLPLPTHHHCVCGGDFYSWLQQGGHREGLRARAAASALTHQQRQNSLS